MVAMNISSRTPIGRLAPSPTGALHLGNIRTFMIAWLQMRSQGGCLRMRIEDLDHPKHKPGATQDILNILQWLGFDWDGDIVVQSQRLAVYQKAIGRLAPKLYPCTCTRADIQSAQSAPHAGEILRYPGTCRAKIYDEPPIGRTLRFALTPKDENPFTDAFMHQSPSSAAELTGDFIVARVEASFQYAYTLAVVVDDAEMGITDVVRGDDILLATPAQTVLYKALGYPLPRFWHVPLVVGGDGRRLAKRHGDTRISSYRDAGISPGRILSALARSCGWLSSSETVETLSELLPRFTFDTIPHTPFIWQEALL